MLLVLNTRLWKLGFSFLFGGFGYGPDSTHTDDHYGTIFDSNYESQGVKYCNIVWFIADVFLVFNCGFAKKLKIKPINLIVGYHG